MGFLWKRRVKIDVNVIQPGDGEYTTSTWSLDTQEKPLRIDFSITEYTAYPFPKGDLKIYNLAPKTRDFLSTAVDMVIHAGYEGDFTSIPLLFKGTPRWSETKYLGQDIVTSFILGGRLEFDQRVELSYEKAQQLETVVKEIIDQAADQVNIRTFGIVNSDLRLVPFDDRLIRTNTDVFGQREELYTSKNWSANGTMSQVLTDLLADYKLVWHCTENGEIHVLNDRLPSLSPKIFISKNNGMIGTPTENKDGVSVRTILNPAIRLRKFIEIESERVELQGVHRFTPTQITHAGSTWDTNWYTSVEAVPSP